MVRVVKDSLAYQGAKVRGMRETKKVKPSFSLYLKAKPL
jgi:hypothetical protein